MLCCVNFILLEHHASCQDDSVNGVKSNQAQPKDKQSALTSRENDRLRRNRCRCGGISVNVARFTEMQRH